MSNSIISLKEILDNPPYELEVKGIGFVKIRDPTKEDRLEAREEAKKMPGWDQLSPEEQAAEIKKRVALKMLIEPKITIKDYMKAPESKIENIIDAIIIHYTLKFNKLIQERKEEIQRFLELLKVKSPSSSTIS